ncbi:MAG: transposase [Blautia sp.]|nr:transposase [Blautia sp.]
MEIVSSYGAEIRKLNKPLRGTLDIYQKAVAWLVPVYDREWKRLEVLPDKNRQFNLAEHLVHETKKNRASYPFDKEFPKMPSYLCRSAIRHALGTVTSYRSRMALWEQGKLTGKPRLSAANHEMPVFYHKEMYRLGTGKDGKQIGDSSEDRIELKLYSGKDWLWYPVRLLHTDLQYLRRHWAGKKTESPVLEKRNRKYFLRFTFKEKVSFQKKELSERKICAVDLGLNTHAVCSVMDREGTVLARKFIDFAGEKDLLNHVTGRIRRAQRTPGRQNQIRKRWKYAVRLNEELSRKISTAICRYAEEQGCDTVVFEYLDIQGKIRGNRKQKLHLWRKRDIQKRCEHKAHRKGIRCSHVNAWGTSAYAYDGSGKVLRDKENQSICTFSSGKRYHCDLSASYNIGARYWLREIIKSLPETERSLLEAEVPAVKRRSRCVYEDLLCVTRVLEKKNKH